MAGLKGTKTCNDVLDSLLGPGGADATLYMALFTTAVTADGVGTEVSTSGTGYARIAVDNATAFATAAAARTKTIEIATDFFTPMAPALANCGHVIWACFVRTASGALTANSVVYAAPLVFARDILIGDSFSVPIGGVIITEQ